MKALAAPMVNIALSYSDARLQQLSFALVVVITVIIAPRVSPQSLPPATRAWEPSMDGLRIAISAASTVPSISPEFLISIQNISKTDFVVNLGFMLANGKVMFPEAVRLSLTDPAGY